jgi:CheY-like chemotaxis protein
MRKEKKKTVLVVEDEAEVRLFLKTVLEDAGFEVVTADNGKQALERIKHRKPDIISLDLVMPRMRGITFIKYLQNNPEWATIPFIVVTAHAYNHLGKEDVLKLKAEKSLAAPHSYLDKPIVASEYIKIIREVLDMEADNTGSMIGRIRDTSRVENTKRLEEALKTLGDYT